MFFYLLAMIESEEERLEISGIYEKYRFICLNVALKITHNKTMAEDAIHDAFVEVIKHKEKILKLSCSKMKSRIIIIVKNKYIDILRKYKKISDISIDDLEYSIDPEEKAVDLQLIDKQGFDNLVSKINQLDEMYKTVFEMKYIHNLSNQEIADELGILKKNVEMRLYRAKVKLRGMIEKEGGMNGKQEYK